MRTGKQGDVKDQDSPRSPAITTWGEHPNYECRMEIRPGIPCPFKTVDWAEWVAHIDPVRGVHREATAAAAPPAPRISDDEREELELLRAFKAEVDANALTLIDGTTTTTTTAPPAGGHGQKE